MSQPLYTADFQQEYAAETSRIVRDRFIWFTALVAGFTLLFSLQRGWNDLFIPLLQWIRGVSTDSWHWGRLVGGLPDMLTIALFGLIGWKAWIGRLSEPDLLKLSRSLIQFCGAVAMVLYPIYTRERLLPLESVFIMHVAAAACLPWSLRDALRPMMPLVLLNAAIVVAMVFWEGFTLPRLVQAVSLSLFSPVVLAPGALIAWVKDRWRSELFRTKFFESQYGQMRRELVDARKLHEALFPLSEARGRFRFDYRYAPMRQIGGDFLFARWDDSGPTGPRLSLVLIDVTGHGLSSALTVNRIAGELERLYAEDPDAPPGFVLSALNRYVSLTLAHHAIYCTAMCVRVDPPETGQTSGTLRYASGGHPPAFIRHIDGSVRRVDSTSLMLGVLPAGEFDAGEVAVAFAEGDTFVAVTDGAVETKSANGDLFGIDRLAALISQPGRGPAVGWAQGVLNAVDTFRSGQPSDDTVVVEVAMLKSENPS